MNIGAEFSRIWLATITEPIQLLSSFPDLDGAIVFFAIGITCAFAVTGLPMSPDPIARRGARTVIAISSSFAAALYLAIIAIIAIPEFEQRIPNIEQIRLDLEKRLKDVSVLEMDALGLVKLKTDRDSMIATDDKQRQATQSLNQATAGPNIVDAHLEYWRILVQDWDQSLSTIDDMEKKFPMQSGLSAKTVVSFFLVSNVGKIGESAAQRHALVLESSFNIWAGNYRAALQECVDSLQTGLGRLKGAYNELSRYRSRSISIPQDQGVADALFRIVGDIRTPRCGTVAPPLDSSYLKPRSGSTETLGLFGAASAWLLRTESTALALIIGLLGFGFFGALAATFTREFRATPGNELPPLGFIVPALVRGIGAAILVFLLAKSLFENITRDYIIFGA